MKRKLLLVLLSIVSLLCLACVFTACANLDDGSYSASGNTDSGKGVYPWEHTHNFDNGHIIFVPTCEDAGLGYWTCLDCELSKIEEIPPLGHLVIEIIDSETCACYGVCLRCEEIRYFKYVHKFEEVFNYDTCAHYEQCTRCGEIRNLTYNHKFEEVFDSTTCAHYEECMGCGEIRNLTYYHKFIDLAPDYYNHYKMCLKCGEIKRELHTVENNKCSVCDYVFKFAGNYTYGLVYTLNEDNASYSVTGIGHATDTEIVIADTYNGLPVTEIGECAFFECNTIETVIMPNSIKTIGRFAFAYSSIEYVTIPDSVTTATYAFVGCFKLMTVELGSGLSELSGEFDYDIKMEYYRYLSIFSSCISLTTIKIPFGLHIDKNVLSGCKNLENIYFTGIEEQWDDSLTDATVYYYRKDYPYCNGVEEGNFWHYVDGEIVTWVKEQ